MDNLLKTFAFLVTVLLGTEAQIYQGYSEWKLSLQTKDELKIVQDLFKLSDVGVLKEKVLFWEKPSSLQDKVVILVSADLQDLLKKYLEDNHISYKILSHDIQKSLDETMARYKARKSISQFAYDPNDFNTIEDIYSYLDELVLRCPSGFQCEVTSIGTTYEGRDIKEFTIKKEEGGRQLVWMDSMFHAREWLAGTTNLGLVDKMMSGYGSDPDATRLLDEFDWLIIPVGNPDGYVFTWTQNRMWRKNRTPNEGSFCIGTDLNRNYDFGWGVEDEGSSADPCSNLYFGAGPASELETQAVVREAQRVNGSIFLWISWHSWDYKWLFPYASTDNGVGCLISNDFQDLDRAGQACVNAVESTYNENDWIAGSFCQVLYESSGVLIDWVAANGFTKYVYTPELRGPTFDPAPSAIGPSTQESWNGLLALIAEIKAIESRKY